MTQKQPARLYCDVLMQIHGENGDAIAMAQKRTFEAGITGPEGHSISRPAYLEVRHPLDCLKLSSTDMVLLCPTFQYVFCTFLDLLIYSYKHVTCLGCITS